MSTTFSSLFAEAKKSSTVWETVEEQRITSSELRQLKSCLVCKGQGRPYARLNWQNGASTNLPLDWETQSIVEVGDYLNKSSLRLLTKRHQETGEEQVYLAGRP